MGKVDVQVCGRDLPPDGKLLHTHNTFVHARNSATCIQTPLLTVIVRLTIK